MYVIKETFYCVLNVIEYRRQNTITRLANKSTLRDAHERESTALVFGLQLYKKQCTRATIIF